MLKKKISFIGFGRMGSALAGGAIGARAVRASSVTAFDPERAARAAAKKLKAKVASSEQAAALAGDIVFLCVKPQQMPSTLEKISGLSVSQRKARCFVSIAAGFPISRLESALGPSVPVLRVMPNTPALLKAGASALSRGRSAKPAHEKEVRAVLSAVGECASVPESAMDAVTAVSGSGPAYVFYLAEAMQAAAEKLGIEPAMARALARQTIYGAGLMLSRRPEDAAELRRQVTSPGGTTAAAIEVFEENDFKALVDRAIAAAAARSAELSKS